MSTNHENTNLGLVPRAVALAISLVITGLAALGFASATNHVPTPRATISIISILN